MTLGRIQRRLSRPISLACGAWDRNDVLAFRKIVIVRTVHCDNHFLCESNKAILNDIFSREWFYFHGYNLNIRHPNPSVSFNQYLIRVTNFSNIVLHTISLVSDQQPQLPRRTSHTQQTSEARRQDPAPSLYKARNCSLHHSSGFLAWCHGRDPEIIGRVLLPPPLQRLACLVPRQRS